MIPLSVVIITYNEEKNIGRCLKAVIPVADDIVVVDSFSKDHTAEIAAEMGARLVTHAFEGHIEQKNFAITQARYPHILSVDADELPDLVLLNEIQKVKANWQADGYSMNRLNNYCGQWIRHGAWYPDTKLRLWDSRKGRWSGVNPHDKFEMYEGCRIVHLGGDLLHYSYKTIDEHKKKVEYFSAIAARAYQARGRSSNWLNIVFSPLFRFIRDYIIRLGFLDGKAGLTIAWLSATEVRKKYIKLRKFQLEN